MTARRTSAGAALAVAAALLVSVSAPAAPPTFGLEGSATVVGGTIHATAELTESPGALGEIEFEVFGPADPTCAGTALDKSSVAVNGEGEYASDDFEPSAAGSYFWTARYTGDGTNEPAEAVCAATSTVSKATPSMTGSASSTTVGGNIHDTANLAGGFSPSGEVTFRVYGPGDTSCATPLETTSATISGGEATSDDFLALQAGAFRWTASYPGDANNEAVQLGCNSANQTSTVAKASPGLSGSATSTAVVGSTITDQVTLSGGFSPGGQIVFRAFGPGDATCGSTAAYEATVAVSGNDPYSPAGFAPGAGVYRWTAKYEGDGNNQTASLTCNASGQSSTVTKATPGLTGSASSATVGGAIHDQVTLTGGSTPSGEVTFSVYGPDDAGCTTPLKTTSATISAGKATSPDFTAPQAGEFRWKASYPGDANNDGVELACNAPNQTSTVAKATPTLTGSASSATVGGNIHDTVTLAGGFSPSGEVTFRVYGPGDTSCATSLETTTVPVSGVKATSADFAPQQAGSFRWTASYPGDANNEPSSLTCNAANQSSVVAKASPGLAGTATSTPVEGSTITDQVTLSGGFAPGGQIVFRAFGPGDASCGSTPVYQATISVSGNGPYSPAGFSPGRGLYRWTAQYEGDAGNQATALSCNASGQSSIVGMLDVSLTASADGATIGRTVAATATLREGASPGGQIVFKVFSPGDENCSGAPAFSSTVQVAGDGTYRSDAFEPSRVGTYRWTISYSGDTYHSPATVACGKAASPISQAKPSIAGAVPQVTTVGTPFSDAVTLKGGFAPNGTVTFRIYGPIAGGCAGSSFVNIVAIKGNGTINSDPFVALRPGRYSFLASYSGDSENQGASEPCDSPTQVIQVLKRSPQVKPRAVLVGGKRISIRARLAGSVSPSGSITFRLYGPSDKGCRSKPKFSGSVKVKANGTFPLARYLATKPGLYRLSVGYTGDPRNRSAKATCGAAQSIRVK
ncbi:MAG: hypothetical protein ACJ75T_11810 [Solirubrobacterales bacterium]